jgi:hypothetical protein
MGAVHSTPFRTRSWSCHSLAVIWQYIGGVDSQTTLALVLLRAPVLPTVERLQWASTLLDEKTKWLVTDATKAGDGGVGFKCGSDSVVIAVADHPVPQRDADEAGTRSASRFMGYSAPAAHQAHLLVVFTPSKKIPALTLLERFAGVLATLAKATNAVGIYWGEAGATHPSDFMIETLQRGLPRHALWCGAAFAKAAHRKGGVSFISLGLHQLGLTELEVTCSENDAQEGIDTLMDLVSYVAKQGHDFEEGETTGRTDDEKLAINRVRSPLDPKATLCRVDLP